MRDYCLIFNDTNIFVSKCLEVSTIYDRIEINSLNSSGKIVYCTETTLNDDTTLFILCFDPPTKCQVMFIDHKRKRFSRKAELSLFEYPIDTVALLTTDLLVLDHNSSGSFALDLIYFYTSKEDKGFKTRFRRIRIFFDENLNFLKSTHISQRDEFTTHRVQNFLAFHFGGFAYFLRVVAHRETNSGLLAVALERLCLHYRATWNESFAGIHAPLLLLKPKTNGCVHKLLTSQNSVVANFDPETNVLQVFVGEYDGEKLIYSMHMYDMQDVHREINRHRMMVSSTKFKYFINCYDNANNISNDLPLPKQLTDKYITVDGVDLCSMSNCRFASHLEYKLVERGRVYSGISMNSDRDGTFYGEISQVINVDREMMLIQTNSHYLLIVAKSGSSEAVFHSALIHHIGDQSTYGTVFDNYTVIFVDGTDVKYISLNCSMKDTCSETVWLRNLRNRFTNCGWCHNWAGQSFGTTPEHCRLSNQSIFLTSHCPPEINCFENDYVAEGNSTSIALDGFFPVADNQRIEVCGSPCNVLSSSESKLLCRTETPIYNGNNLKGGQCPITLETMFLNETYTISPKCAKKLFFAGLFPTSDRHHRVLFFTISMSFVILIPLALCICCLCRNSPTTNKKSDADSETSSESPLSIWFLNCVSHYGSIDFIRLMLDRQFQY
uniref:Sema domain-containing protein n=1 Tax=Romanomermis culicivorax TaxID=13658 RepID=A0A915KY46_ROMCU